VKQRWAAQLDRIAKAALAAGREPQDVCLIAVSKRQDVEKIRQAYEAGQRDFGENYVQELLSKAEALRELEGIRWHLIGHLQSNKARQVAAVVHTVHTVSNLKLVRELSARVAQKRPPDPADASGAIAQLRVLLEVNISGEESKSGCAPAQTAEIAQAVDDSPHLTLRGLMTVPPHHEDPRAARPYFERLAELRDELGGAERLPELSMGMSADAEVAISCGATMVRIGTAIFGARSD
jgi:hypothetical protein